MAQLRLILCIILIIPVSLTVDGQRKKAKTYNNQAEVHQEAEFYYAEGEKFFILEDYAKALLMFQKSLEILPQNSAAFFKKAQIEYHNGEYQKALEDIEIAISLETNKYYFLQKIDILKQLGQLKDVSESYQDMINAIPETSIYLSELASLQLYMRDFENALSTYQKIQQIEGENVENGMQIHRIYLQMNKTQKAQEQIEDLYKLYPENEDVGISYAEFLLSIKEDLQAINLLENLLNVRASGREQLLVGEIYRKNKEYVKATPHLVNAFKNQELSYELKLQLTLQYLELKSSEDINFMISTLCTALIDSYPEESGVLGVYGDFLNELGKTDEAAIQYQKAIEIDASNFSVWQNLLLILSNKQQYDQVIETCDKALVIYPNQSVLYYLSGYAFLQQNQFQSAKHALTTGKRLIGSNRQLNVDFNTLLAEAYHGLKDYTNSNLMFDEVLKLDPSNALALNNYAYYLALRKEDLDKAEKMSTFLIKEHSDNSNFLDTHAQVLYAKSKYKEARKVIEKAIAISPKSALIKDHYGNILFQLGNVEEAVVQWKEAKALDSTIKSIDKKIEDKKLYEN